MNKCPNGHDKIWTIPLPMYREKGKFVKPFKCVFKDCNREWEEEPSKEEINNQR